MNTSYVENINEKSTGLAQINVAENGENQIIIIPGKLFMPNLLEFDTVYEFHLTVDSIIFYCRNRVQA